MKSKKGIILLPFVAAAWGLNAALTPLAVGEPQIPEGWEIVEIFPAGTEYFCGPPDINDRGQIVFLRQLWPVRNQIEIMLYNRGRLSQVTDDEFYDAFPSLNNHGHIVWQRDLDPDPGNERVGIVKWIGNGKLEIISDQPFHEGSADINDAGQIVWMGIVDPSAARPQIFFFDGTAVRQVTDDNYSNQSPRINKSAEFVFTQYDFGAKGWLSNIFGYFNRILRRLSRGQQQAQQPNINDLRQVVWTSPSRGLELWDNGTIETLFADSLVYGSRLNNHGDVCTSRWDPANNNPGLWLKRRGSAWVQLTDGTFGGNLSNINNRGEIAFQHGHPPGIGIALFTKKCFRGDFDSDGDRDLRDYSILQANFGADATDTGDACWNGDTNEDGMVDGDDFVTFVSFYGGPQ